MSCIQVQKLSKKFAVKRKEEGIGASLRSLLRPRYAEKVAVNGIDLQVGQGETLAFLGPNGAGKSTTIKMLTGILHPSDGRAEVLGLCPWTQRSRLAYRIGSVFGQKSQLWYHLPPADSFELMSRIYELKRNDYHARRDELVRRFELEPYLHTPVRKLSLGERMRCEIAAAVLHRPQILFLDEPTIGLDVVVKAKIRELILEMNREEGTTVFLTSHDPGDIEHLCRRAVVINYGEVIFDDTVDSMKRDLLTGKTISLQLLEPGELLRFRGVEVLEQTGTSLKLAVDTAAVSTQEVLTHLVGAYRVSDITVEDPPMEAVITHIYERERGGSHAG
ncbi:ABC transporter [Paenibacillus mucilaginosus 3016]|uniref:ABC transporter n=1 Tax=Paenibacillus mucilaginosus 3016 TaxID=1116391 RepID=H6NBE8_9BACL|nr:ATP-binding cassette domain-containing protein [Paenibacillus mucilaginosus]AFC32894.1 ABC transporter [Paenibacillus mucilaginosus 3016]WFA21345.1 ATP-binding cassette domain-containing protein [Paenibacillus mucilaginosus]